METLLRPVTLVLGGAGSGKSVFAESLICAGFGNSFESATYIATASAGDDEMTERIRRHRARRGLQWRTLEEHIDLPNAIRDNAHHARPILVDCLTLWLSNLLLENRDIEQETDKVIAALEAPQGPVVLVSNEVGLGIVPTNAVARKFRDRAGRLNQAVAAVANTVYFVAAGLPLTLKEN